MMKLLAWLVVLLVGFALAQPASAQGRGGGGPSGGGPSGSVGAAQGVGSAVSPIVINPYTTGLEKAGEVADENADFGLGTAGGVAAEQAGGDATRPPPGVGQAGGGVLFELFSEPFPGVGPAGGGGPPFVTGTGRGRGGRR